MINIYLQITFVVIDRSQAYLIYHFAIIGCMQNKYVCIQKAHNAAGFRTSIATFQ